MIGAETIAQVTLPHWLGWFWYLMPFSLNRHEGWVMWLDSARFGLRPVQTALFAVALGGCFIIIPLLMTRRYQDCPKAAVSWVVGTILTLALVASSYHIYRSVPFYAMLAVLLTVAPLSIVFIMVRWFRLARRASSP